MTDLSEIISASNTDMDVIRKLLQDNGLPVSDVNLENTYFFAAYLNGRIIGSIGLQVMGSVALLRSMVVEDRYRNLQVGKQLYEKVMELAVEKQIQEVFLITTTAQAYFGEKGFEVIAREQVPELIQQTTQFSKTCPGSGIVMHKLISKHAFVVKK
ncbi:GNAT family N-acetyltransferase [Rhodocytophaga rosea]|uniref:GNAT family N-acetyltransferase n=1 Tax=Rhodocytophaga rosea TaxID=2704465 RepID=A0A6C0GGR8_9BACT|nr:arsenic resistance N-acetyltransferase ArsN2 [Rhodocytophaga rosea]QHT67157.1 GNAT family N-acetyltransferase [Rhodocytophaga rosea]